MARERLQRILARAGIASRRAAESLITEGRVRVSGVVVTRLGSTADPRTERIEVDGRRISAQPLVYVVFHKPRNVVCTLRDPEGRPTVADYVRQVGVRIVPVGRLDFQTSGTLLLTNDGDFAKRLSHPSHGAPKEYVAKVKGEVDDLALADWEQSIIIEGRATSPAAVRRLRFEEDKTWLSITLREGRNRQVRRLGEATGFRVMRLCRISYAGITCEGLRPGAWRHLTSDELRDLKREFGVPARVRPAPNADVLGASRRRSSRDRRPRPAGPRTR